MKKILKLLESYVQWAALVVGAAFLGFMVWSYIFQNPAAKTMTANGETVNVTPGTVDPAIKAGVVDHLTRLISPTTPLNISAAPLASLPWGPPATQPTIREAAYSWPQDLGAIAEAQGNNPAVGLIQSLPALPRLNYLDNEELRTVLQVPAPNGAPPTKQDEDSVTTFWTLPLAALAQAYDASFAGKLGPDDQKIVFAHADLVRQQQMPDGSWGPDVVIARQDISGALPPYPGKNSPAYKDQAAAYSAWLSADKNQKTIVSGDYPPVYYSATDRPDLQWKTLEAMYGERAGQPGAPAGANPQGAANPQAGPNAQAAAPPIVNPFGPAPDQGAAATPAVAPPGAAGAQPAPVHADGKRSAAGNGGIAGNPVIGGIGQQVVDANHQPAAAPVAAAAPAPVALPTKLPPLQAVPDGAFSASALAKQPGDLELYFHDMTVDPGGIYRYKVRYSVTNPVYGKPKALTNPADADAFVIDSPFSDWSQTISVPQRTRFWCADKQPSQQLRSTGRVDFTVFVWHDGAWNKKDYPGVSTGDEIGDGDFVSHVTLLGAVAPPGTEQPRQILLVPDTGGPAEVRNERNDATNPDFQSFLKTIAAQTAPGGAAPTGIQPPNGGQPQPTGPGQLAPGA